MKQFRHAVIVPVFLAMFLASGCGTSGSSGGLSFNWKNYPHLFTHATARPWIVLMCNFPDTPNPPAALYNKARMFLTTLGSGTGNMVDYWSDVSYGAISIAGSEVHGWYTTPYTYAFVRSGGLIKKYGLAGARYESVQLCADQVPASDVDFSQFYGVIVVLSKVVGAGACGMSSVVEQGHHLACVLFDPNSFFTGFAAQEMGHGYGLAHSSDETHAQYADPFDVMSTLNAKMFQGCNYVFPGRSCHDSNSGGWDGPGLNVPNLLALGWIPPKHVATYTIDAGEPPQTITLAALSHPDASSDLALLVVDPFDASELYTVEFRTPDGWDQGFGTPGVYIHEYTPIPLDSVTLYSFLQKKGTDGGQLFAGDSWTGTSWSGPSTSWRVDVLSIGQTTATIQIHTVSGGLIGDEPVVQIQAPADDSHVTAGTPFQLVARATTSSGTPLPSSSVVWTANGTHIGTGATLTTSLSASGSPYNITVTGTDPSQLLSATASITLYVDPPATPPPAPTAQILSPTSGQSYRFAEGSSFQIVLSASASAGVTQYAWSDALHLFTDSKANDTVTITQQQVGCQSQTDTIYLTVTDSHGQTASATPVTISLYPECTS